MHHCDQTMAAYLLDWQAKLNLNIRYQRWSARYTDPALSAATIKGPPQAHCRHEHGTRLPPQTRDHLVAPRPRIALGARTSC